jgi:hypothetical protein
MVSGQSIFHYGLSSIELAINSSGTFADLTDEIQGVPTNAL